MLRYRKNFRASDLSRKNFSGGPEIKGTCNNYRKLSVKRVISTPVDIALQTVKEKEGDSNGRFKKHCGFLLGSGLTLVLDHIQVDGRCRTTKTDSG